MAIPAIIDAHVHFWDLERFRYPWLDAPEVASLRRNCLPNDLGEAAHGLDLRGVVHVQAEVDHAVDPVEETTWLEDLRGKPPGGIPSVCVGYADLRAPDLEDTLLRHCDQPLFRGIRQEAWYDPQSQRADLPRANFLSDPLWVAGLPVLARHGASFDLMVWWHQLHQAAEIFRRLPDLPVILEHTGLPPHGDDMGMEAWRVGITAFATEVPWSVLKLSGLHHISPTWRLEELKPLVQECIDIFGPDRCMFASDFPVGGRDSSSYARLWTTYDQMTQDLGESDRQALFSRTAARTYRIEDSA
jgi:predicted TIM-barrel fold metal-dependent hydrolase